MTTITFKGQMVVRLLREGGLTRAEIAQKTGMSVNAVAYHARKLGVPAQKGASAEQVRSLLLEGMTPREVAKATGASLGAVYYHSQQLGFVRLPRRDWSAIQAFHDAGHTTAETMGRFDISEAGLRFGRSSGKLQITFDPKPRKNARKLSAEDIVALWRDSHAP